MKRGQASCGSSAGGCCRVEAVVSVDERGQMVLPKEVRERAGLKVGEKLALVVWESEGQVCCISLLKTDQLGGMVKSLLAPMLNAVQAKD